MKETKRETVVVTEYATDFGTTFPDKDLCMECEGQEYKEVYASLYNIANDKQRILLKAMAEELIDHLNSVGCEQGIGNDSLRYLIEEIYIDSIKNDLQK